MIKKNIKVPTPGIRFALSTIRRTDVARYLGIICARARGAGFRSTARAAIAPVSLPQFRPSISRPGGTLARRSTLIGLLLPLAAMCLLAISAHAQVPRTISYQGVLTNNGAAASGEHLITVALYDSPTSGTPLYQESHQVTIANGMFNIEIGSITPIPATLTFDAPYYLGVSIDGNSELTPRVSLDAAPYAITSGTAQVAEGLAPGAKGVVTSINELAGPLRITGDSITTVTENGNNIIIHAKSATPAGIQSITSNDKTISIANGTGPNVAVGVADSGITTPKIANSAVTPEKLAQAGATKGQILKWNGSAWAVANDSTDHYVAGQGISISNNSISLTGGPAHGTILNSTLRWNGVNWVENPSMTSDSNGNTAINGSTNLGDGTGADNITMSPGSGQVRVKGWTEGVVVSNETGVLSTSQLASGAGISIVQNAGTITISDTGSTAWTLAGNSGTNPLTNFLGTTDNAPFEIHVDNADAAGHGSKRVLRFEPNATSANIIAGYQGNYVTPGAAGATISGGGLNGFNNTVSDDFGVVGGGSQNRAGNNSGSAQDASHATVAGGGSNTASGIYSSVLGGTGNTASGAGAAVGGGSSNQATGAYSTVSGGIGNLANDTAAAVSGAGNTAGKYSAIPGGENLHLGANSFGVNVNGSGNPVDLSGASNLAYLGDMDLWLGNLDNSARAIRFYAPGTNVNYSTRLYSAFLAGAQSATINYTLPTSQPIARQVLTATNVSGTGPFNVALGWTTSDTAFAWNVAGNSGTTPGTNFLGTTDNQAMEILVKNGTAVNNSLTLNPNGSMQRDASGNTRGTSSIDLQTTRTSATQVASGNYDNLAGGQNNTISSDKGVIAGGETNTVTGGDGVIGGGGLNYNAGTNGTIAGGYGDTVLSSTSSTIGGGTNNLASANYSTISGGSYNHATGAYSAISGGTNNFNGGSLSSIVGGGYLRMTGNNSFGFHAGTGSTDSASVTANNTAYFGNANLWLGNTNNTASQLRFYGAQNGGVNFPGASTHYTSFAAAGQTADFNYTLPASQPGANQVLAATNITGSGPYNVTLGWQNENVTDSAWGLAGNSGTTAGTNYIGTADNQPFEIHIYNSDASSRGSKRVMRFEPMDASPNIIGGYQGNTVSSGVNGATIAGGGSSGDENEIASDYGTVSGGRDNRINSGQFAAISGGGYNAINSTSDFSFIGGGNSNTINSAKYSAIGGGQASSISGDHSVIPGGDSLALGGSSFGVNVPGTSALPNVLDLSSFSNLAYFGNMDVWLGNTDNTARALRFYAPGTSTSYSTRTYSAFLAGAQTATLTYTLPTSQPSADQVLAATSITGSGPYNVTMGWATALTMATGVIYGPASLQATLTPRSTPLYNIGYSASASNGNATGAEITSSAGTSGNYSATGLTITATGAGTGNTTGISVNASGSSGTILAVNATGNINIDANSSYQIGNEPWLWSGPSHNIANVFVGLTENTSNAGIRNTVLGNDAGTQIASGDDNTFLGSLAGNHTTSGTGNSFVGVAAGEMNISGGSNTALGRSAGESINGDYNSFLGVNAGEFVTSGSYLTLIGFGASSSNGLTNAAAIGANAVVSENNAIVLGSTGTYVGIGSSAPSQLLNVENGNLLLSRTGTYGADTLRFQGTSTGLSTFAAGAQGSTTINYTLPTSQPTADQVLAATNITGSGPYAVTLGWTSTGGGAWNLTGNSGTTDGSDFLGTSDNVPFTIRANNQQAVRIQPSQLAAASFVGGGANNTIAANDTASFIGFGDSNHIAASYASNIGGALGTVTGDYSNITSSYSSSVSGQMSAIVAGEANRVSGDRSMIAGGSTDTITNSDGFIGGGFHNVVNDENGAIAGGQGNQIQASAINGGILAGESNFLGGSNSAIIGGGYLHMSGNNSVGFHAGSGSTDSASVTANNTAYLGNVNLWLGNTNNTASELRFYGAQNGGVNFPGASTYFTSFSAAGQTADINYTLPSSAPAANEVLAATTVTGSGPYNVTLAWAAGTSGGWNLTGNSGTTAGTNFLGTTDNQAIEIAVKNGATVNNSLILNPNGSVQRDAGGNTRGTSSIDFQAVRTFATQVASGNYDNLAGGQNNTISSDKSVIAGGESNTVTGADGVVGGGGLNYNAGTNGTIAGGYGDTVMPSASSTIGGGTNNMVSADNSTISGGRYNHTTGAFSTISGGTNNFDGGALSSIVGGGYLRMTGNNSFGFNAGTGSADSASVTGNNTAYFGNVNLWLGNTNNTASELRFYSAQSGGVNFPGVSTHFTSFAAAGQTADIYYTLPSSQPATNQVLAATSISGSGPYNVALSWTTPATGDTGWGRWGNTGTTPGTNFLGTTDNKDLVFKTNATEAMRVTSAGAIGIGTSTPSNKLDISNGNLSLSRTGSATDTLKFQGTSTGSSNFIAGVQGATTIDYTLPISQPATNQVLAATSISGSGPYNVALSWTTPATGDTGWGRWGNSGTTPGTNFLGTTDNKDLVIKTNATEAMRVTSAGAIGIGTSTPSNKLDISNGNLSLSRTGSATDTLKFQGTSTGSSNFIAGVQGATTINYTLPTGQPSANQYLAATSISGGGPYAVALSWTTPATGDTGWGRWGNTGTTPGTNFLGTADNKDLVIKTNATEAMRVTSAGAIGIGTSTPSNKLDISNGNLSLSRTGTASDTLKFQGTSTGSSDFIAGAQGATTINYTLPTGQPSANQYLAATSISGSGPYAVALSWTTPATGDTGWGRWGNTGTTPGTNFLGTTDNKDLVFKTNATEAMRVTSAGAIGIGTSTPSNKLDVSNGNLSLSRTGTASDTLKFQGTSTGYSNFLAGAQGGTTVNYTLPTTQPSSNQVLAATSIAGTGPYNVALGWATRTSDTGWGINGNSGTIAGTNFLGTTDNEDLVIKTDATEVMRVSTWGDVGIGTSSPSQRLSVANGNIFLSRTGASGPDLVQFEGTSTGTSSIGAGAQGATSIEYTLPTAPPSANQVLTASSIAGTAPYRVALAWTAGSGGSSGWGLTGNSGTTPGTNFLGTTDNKDLVIETNSTEAMRVTSAGAVGIGTSTPADLVQSVYSGTNDEYAAIEGNATGSTTNQSIGLWGDASNTNTANTGTIGVLATGNGNTGAGNTNVALQVNDGEFTMGRTTEAPGTGSDVEPATAGTAYTQEGPSGVVELSLGAAGNLATSAPTAGTIQDLGSVTINNRYCEAGSIVLTNVVAMIDDGTAPNPQDAAWIVNADNTASGSFVIRVKMIPTSTSASNYSTSDKIHIGYMIVNKSK